MTLKSTLMSFSSHFGNLLFLLFLAMKLPKYYIIVYSLFYWARQDGQNGNLKKIKQPKWWKNQKQKLPKFVMSRGENLNILWIQIGKSITQIMLKYVILFSYKFNTRQWIYAYYLILMYVQFDLGTQKWDGVK